MPVQGQQEVLRVHPDIAGCAHSIAELWHEQRRHVRGAVETHVLTHDFVASFVVVASDAAGPVHRGSEVL
ncbi:hypothetical protein GCM10009551_019100 [Nocardiopsis tropica]